MQPETVEECIAALRADVADMRQDMSDMRQEMRAKFDLAAAGQQQIVGLLEGLIDAQGGPAPA